MSEHTTGTAGDMGEASEPSMEDILASIRKIIAEDDPIAMQSPEDEPLSLATASTSLPVSDVMASVANVEASQFSDPLDTAPLDTAPLDTAPLAIVQDDESGTVDLGLDSLLAELAPETLDSVELDVTENVTLPEVTQAPAFVVAEEPPNTDETDQLLELVGMNIDLAEDEPQQKDLELSEANSSVEQTGHSASIDTGEIEPLSLNDDDLEMDALLDSVLLDDIDFHDAGSDAPSADDDAGPENEDLELVKSLMADLADDPDMDLDEDLSIPEIVETEQVVVDADLDAEPVAEGEEIEAQPDDAEDDILDEILNMSLDDEIATHPADLDLDDDLNLEVEIYDIEDMEAVNLAAAEDVPSLSDIAAEARQDADVNSGGEGLTAKVAATAGLAGIGAAALGASALGQEPAEDLTESEIETAQPAADHTPDIQQETSPMPAARKVKSDAILDDVTETATAEAFASLNQVVEEKAVFNERGPRIGDLVQEALRPMLKEWLDANLKGIVERAVAKEVKRISTGK